MMEVAICCMFLGPLIAGIGSIIGILVIDYKHKHKGDS